MELNKLLDEGRILIDFKAKDKEAVLGALVDKIANGFDRESVLAALRDREELGSTGIGNGVAVPHIRDASVTEPVVAFGRSRQPIDFGALDDTPCSFFFLVIGPTHQDAQDVYLKLMAKISRLMRSADVREALAGAADASEVAGILAKHQR